MEDVNRILKEANESLAQAKKLNAAAGYQIKQTEKAMDKINKNMETTVNKLDKTAQDAIQVSIDLLKENILQCEEDIFVAEECQDLTDRLWSVWPRKSHEADDEAKEIYGSGCEQTKRRISRCEDKIEKFKAEIRRLEWQLKN